MQGLLDGHKARILELLFGLQPQGAIPHVRNRTVHQSRFAYRPRSRNAHGLVTTPPTPSLFLQSTRAAESAYSSPGRHHAARRHIPNPGYSALLRVRRCTHSSPAELNSKINVQRPIRPRWRRSDCTRAPPAGRSCSSTQANQFSIGSRTVRGLLSRSVTSSTLVTATDADQSPQRWPARCSWPSPASGWPVRRSRCR